MIYVNPYVWIPVIPSRMSICGLPRWLSGREPACQHRRRKRHGFDPWIRKIPWRSNGNPLQASCLENPMERGAWRATVCGVVESRTRLKQHGMHECLCVSAFIYHISMHHQFINHVSAVHLSAIFVTYASIYMFMYICTCVLRSSVVSNYL